MQSDDMNCQSISQIFSSSLVGEQSNKPKIVPIIQKHFGMIFHFILLNRHLFG